MGIGGGAGAGWAQGIEKGMAILGEANWVNAVGIEL
jgi:hypothetical protein